MQDPCFHVIQDVIVTKILSLLILILMVLHLWKPLGFPGMKFRRDVWKIAVFALCAMGVATLFSHH